MVNKNSSVSQFTNNPEELIKSHKTPAIAIDKPLRYLYNGRDSWYEVDTYDLMNKMRNTYNSKKVFNREKVLPNYSYDIVANKINEALND